MELPQWNCHNGIATMELLSAIMRHKVYDFVRFYSILHSSLPQKPSLHPF